MLTIHPANTLSGEYDVNRPLPYPYHIEDDNSVARQDFWRGTPAYLLGFQLQLDIQTVDLTPDQVRQDISKCIGTFPVFATRSGEIYNLAVPIRHARTYEER